MLEKKYSIVYIKQKHFYKYNLTKRDYTFIYGNPVYIKIYDTVIEDTSWNSLLKRVSNYLLNTYKPKIKNILNVYLDWNNQNLFYYKMDVKDKESLTYDDLILNSYQNNPYLIFVLQALLQTFNVDLTECELIIHKYPGKEKPEVNEYFKKRTLKYIKHYLKSQYNYSQKTIFSVTESIKKIDYYVSKYFVNYKSILLFESKHAYGAFKSKFKTKITKDIENKKYLKIIYKILDIFTEYYAYYEKNWFILEKF